MNRALVAARAFSTLHRTSEMEHAGFRFGPRGTQSSRTIMLRELAELLNEVPPDAKKSAYTAAIVGQNVLGKPTLATCRISRQRLREMYGLDPAISLFRVLRLLWRADPPGRPLLALFSALARDPLLRLTAHPVLVLSEGEELVRSVFTGVIRKAVGTRMKTSTVDKVASNAASSWTQSGHLLGSRRRLRCRVTPSAGAAAMALWLGEREGRAGISLLESDWALVLDLHGKALLPLVLEAKRLGLIRARVAGNVFDFDTRNLDPGIVPK